MGKITLRAALLVWTATILAVIVAAPLAASAARPEGWFLYEAFAPFCHQQAERSWHLQGHPLAVCARCLGVYGGVLLAGLAGWRLPAKTIGTAIALVALTWGVEFTGAAAVSDGIRWLTGLVLGANVGGALLALTPPASSTVARARGIRAGIAFRNAVGRPTHTSKTTAA